MGMLFIPVALLLLLSRLDIISRISFLVQRDIRNDSLQGSVKYWSKDLKFGFILEWIVGATEQKKLLHWLAISFGLVRNSPLLLRIILGDSDSLDSLVLI